MALEAERMQILKMLEEGKITAEEAAQLLAALNVGAEKEQLRPETPPASQKKRRVRICVTDKASGKQKKVNVNLPLGVVKAVRKFGGKFPPNFEGFKLDDVFEAIDSEIQGKVVEIQEDDDGKRVEIFVE
jgi:hypothetical protein